MPKRDKIILCIAMIALISGSHIADWVLDREILEWRAE